MKKSFIKQFLTFTTLVLSASVCAMQEPTSAQEIQHKQRAERRVTFAPNLVSPSALEQILRKPFGGDCVSIRIIKEYAGKQKLVTKFSTTIEEADDVEVEELKHETVLPTVTLPVIKAIVPAQEKYTYQLKDLQARWNLTRGPLVATLKNKQQLWGAMKRFFQTANSLSYDSDRRKAFDDAKDQLKLLNGDKCYSLMDQGMNAITRSELESAGYMFQAAALALQEPEPTVRAWQNTTVDPEVAALGALENFCKIVKPAPSNSSESQS